MINIEDTKIVVYPNLSFNQEYRIDKEGNVWSPYRGWHLVSKQEIQKGYYRVGLMTDKGRKFFMVHRLVMEAFNPIENSLDYEVNHIDGNKHNNNIKNLEWCTGSYNVRHSLETGLKTPARGTQIAGNKLNETQVLEICDLLQSGMYSLTQIGEKYGVSKHCIFDIKRKKSWSWLTQDYTFE